RMHLHRKFLMGKEKLEQQRKTFGITRSFAHQFSRVLLTQLRESFPGERPVGDFAVVATQPRFPNFLSELVVGINWRQVVSAPRTRIERGKHQQWIEIFHGNLRPQTKKTARNGTACAE